MAGTSLSTLFIILNNIFKNVLNIKIFNINILNFKKYIYF